MYVVCVCVDTLIGLKGDADWRMGGTRQNMGTLGRGGVGAVVASGGGSSGGLLLAPAASFFCFIGKKG